MDLNKFLEELRKMPRDWYIAPGGMIRRPHFKGSHMCECPISSLYLRPSIEWWVAQTQYVMLEHDIAIKVVNAADRRHRGYDKFLRNRLLIACGLPTEPIV